MSEDINKNDDVLELEKQNRGFESRLKDVEDEVGELGKKVDNLIEQQQETNRILKEGFGAVVNSLKQTVGDQKHAKELEEIRKSD